jgi:hypothetical protein
MRMMATDLSSDAHSAVAVAIAERFTCQPRDMTWEERCDELATAAIEAMQIFIQMNRGDGLIPVNRKASGLKLFPLPMNGACFTSPPIGGYRG